MAVKGVFASDSGINGGHTGDFASGLLQTMPTGSAPFLALSSGMESADAKDIIITWFEENHLSGRVEMTNNAGIGEALTITDSTQLVPGTTMLCETTGEVVFVDAVAGSAVTVTRGLGGTAITAIDGSGTPVHFQRLGTAHEEGSAKPIAIANLGFPRFNYTQIFRNAWDVTGTADAVEYHTGDIKAKNQRDAAVLHSEDMERSILRGVRSAGTLNGKAVRTMDGIVNQLETNLFTQSVNTKYSDIDAFLKAIFSRNIKGKPNERIVFMGNTALSVLNEIAFLNGQMNLTSADNEFGLDITAWKSPYGRVVFQTHPLFNENPTWSKDMLAIHPGAVRTRYLRRTHEDKNDTDGSRAGADADFGVYTTEMTLEYRAEKTGGFYTGMDTAAAGL